MVANLKNFLIYSSQTEKYREFSAKLVKINQEVDMRGIFVKLKLGEKGYDKNKH